MRFPDGNISKNIFQFSFNLLIFNCEIVLKQKFGKTIVEIVPSGQHAGPPAELLFTWAHYFLGAKS